MLLKTIEIAKRKIEDTVEEFDDNFRHFLDSDINEVEAHAKPLKPKSLDARKLKYLWKVTHTCKRCSNT